MADDYNLYPLQVFRIVAKHGSVTRAAEELFISQPAISAHLRQLEERYEEQLFERTPRGVLLTPAGGVVLEHADRLFALRDDIPAALDALRGTVRGEVMVAASSTPGAYLVPALLRRFQERYPETDPILRVGDSAEVLGWLHDWSISLGVVGETKMGEELHREQIGSDELRLVTRAGDSLCRVKGVEAKHLKARTLLLREQGSSTRSGAESLLGGLLKEFGRVTEVRNTEAIKQMVAAGLGLAVLSSWATRLEEKAGLLQPVRDKRLRHERRFFLVRRRDRPLTGVTAALWECLMECRGYRYSN